MRTNTSRVRFPGLASRASRPKKESRLSRCRRRCQPQQTPPHLLTRTDHTTCCCGDTACSHRPPPTSTSQAIIAPAAGQLASLGEERCGMVALCGHAERGSYDVKAASRASVGGERKPCHRRVATAPPHFPTQTPDVASPQDLLPNVLFHRGGLHIPPAMLLSRLHSHRPGADCSSTPSRLLQPLCNSQNCKAQFRLTTPRTKVHATGW
ncbi:hypothetical protein PVAP13_8KG207406 [Panicum virgatum]|uniref:Uncharacterized protein n=1 Tax=Panicum virgatum TaxID=38727 RepID=A0A8T0PKY8_PANVG|nr:hypothetical protein PVAP13_8KG207406 [Panicum virgatum]